MSISVRSKLSGLIAALAATAAAQTTPPPGGPAPTPSPIHRLDAYVVSAGPDPKTSFDLAQGTAVLSGDELHRLVQATLGETLAGTPGVSSTYYGPGASRPVIRGLTGDRVRVLDNGVGSLDASNVSPDHNTAIEPLFASRIEVLRGPSTLLYGSSAVGGAVNVISNSIPDTPPDGKARGATELRLGGAARERALVVTSGGGGNGFGVQVNAMSQRSSDVDIPGVARRDVEAPTDQVRGRLPNSAIETFSGSAGGSVFWSQGHAGAAVSHYATEYGVPNGEAEPVSIRLRQTRLSYELEVNAPGPAIRSLKARLGQGDYWHAELSDRTRVNTTFTNRAAEGRLELAHATIGPVSGMIGLQGSRSDFAAFGNEVATPPSLTEAGAFFALEEIKLGDTTTLQAGGRTEVQRLTLGRTPNRLPPVPSYAPRENAARIFSGTSGAIGLVNHPAPRWTLAASLALSSRLPTAQELFSNGPHGGTGTYEVGNTDLKPERSTGLEVSVRHRGERVSGAWSIFTHRFRGYVLQEDIDERLIPKASNPDGLRVMQYAAKDAHFTGAEVEITFHLLPEAARRLDLEFAADTVRAVAERPAENLPRIPAAHQSLKLVYEEGRLDGTLELQRTAPQTRVAPGEKFTAGYSRLNASASWQLAASGPRRWELFARGTNLTNAEGREHGSFLKEFAPLPGRGLTLGARLRY